MPLKKSRVEKAIEEENGQLETPNDDLIGTEKISLEELFQTPSIKEFNEQVFDPVDRQVKGTGRRFPIDWSVLSSEFEKRTASSPTWFVQLRKEDLLLDPDGLIGQTVECFVVVESPKHTLAPRHYIQAIPLPHSDAEDHVPESVMALKDQGVNWDPIVKADGSDTNAFFMRRAAPKISFGIDVASKPVMNSPMPLVAPSNGFGFGGAAVGSNSPIPFCFGAPTPKTESEKPVSFGFSAMPFGENKIPMAAAAGPMSFGFGFQTGNGAASMVTKISTEDILFTLWRQKRVSEMLKEAKQGSRIVLHNVVLPGLDDPVTVQMQDDMKDAPEVAAKEFVASKIFAKKSKRITDFDKWMEDVPELDPMLMQYLQKTRARFLSQEIKEDTTFTKQSKEIIPVIVEKLNKAVADRKPFRERQIEVLENIATLLKTHKLASKDECRVYKFYPSNSNIPFRPFGRVSGISEAGDVVNCVPPAYVPKNPFMK